MKRFVFFMFLVFMVRIFAFGQEVSVKTSFDTTRILIGDQINYSVKIVQPSDLKVDIPILKDTLCKNIEILAGPLTDTSFIDNDKLSILHRYLITSFDTGFYQVKPIYAELKSEDGLKRFYSDYSQLEVIRTDIAPADTTAKIFDIVKPYRAPLTIEEIMPWLLLVIAIALFIWMAIKYLPRLKKTKERESEPVQIDPAHIIAFRELEKLKEEKLWQKGEIKIYYSELTEILRRYLENRFRVYSLELTTSETLFELIKTGFKKDESFKRLKSVLTAADLVKFAKHNPDPSENDLHFQDSWDFVNNTKEKEQLVNNEIIEKKRTGEELK